VRDEVFGTIFEALVFAIRIADGTTAVRTSFKA
jgi:DNA polymerase